MDQGWIIKCIGLFFETFIHEDLAIITGGMLVSKDAMPAYVVFLAIVAGLLAGDIVIYGLGWGARKVPWIYRKFYSQKVEKAKEKIEKNLVSTLVLVRLVPGILFPTYVACGFTGVAFGQFILTTITTGATYTAILLTIIVKAGHSIIPAVGTWLWIVLFALVLGTMAFRLLRQTRLAAVSENNEVVPVNALSFDDHQEIKGMPSLRSFQKKVAVSEKIPQLFFYSPVAIRWLLLGIKYRNLFLPTVSNPLIEAGGLWGESKSRLMDQISHEQHKWVAPYTTVAIREDLTTEEIAGKAMRSIEEAGLSFPLVLKPDIGWQGYGVRKISDEDELKQYLCSYPRNTILIIQKLVDWEGEAGVFYSRLPGEEHGRIISLTLRYFPHVIGDGRSTVRDLINGDERTRFKLRFYKGKDTFHRGLSEEKLNYIPAAGEVFRLAFIGSIRVGGLYRNGSEYITQSLQERFNAIGKSIPEFYFGRFDIRFRSLDSLMNGEEFFIFEVNGAGAEAIHVWDASTPILDMYREMFRYQSLMFRISDMNRRRGFDPMNTGDFIKFTRRYNTLISSYPASE